MPGSAEYPAGDLLQLGNALGERLQPTRLDADGLDLGGWQELMEPLARIERGASWWLGDAVVYAQLSLRLGMHEIEAMLHDLGLGRQTLKNVATVARWV